MNGRQKVFPPVHRGSRLSGLTADGAFSVSCAPARAIMALLTCQGVAIRSKLGLRRRHVLSNAKPEEHTSDLQSLLRNSYAVFCLQTQNPLVSAPELRHCP